MNGPRYVNPPRRVLAALLRRAQRVGRLHRLHRWRQLCGAGDGAPFVTRLGNDLRIHVTPNPRDVVSERIFVDRYFEAPECRFVQSYLRPGMTVLDVGANIGQYTLIAAERVGPTGHVHSFEPNPSVYEQLDRNVALNGFQDRCTLNDLAVTDRAGAATLSLHAPGENVFSSLGAHQRVDQVGQQAVRTITLDEYVENLAGTPVVDFIKMDIEGAELPALQGARRLLSRPDAPALIVEISDTNTAAFGYPAQGSIDLIESLGYVLYEPNYLGDLIPLRTRHGHALEVNVVALRSARGHHKTHA